MNIVKEKRKYNSPEICRIQLDNEISLALESSINPQGEPEGWGALNQNNMSSDPFKNQLG